MHKKFRKYSREGVEMTEYKKTKEKIKLIAQDEVFKDIEGFNGNLKVSNYGRVWENEKTSYSGNNYNVKKIHPPRIVRQSDNLRGYFYITIQNNGEKFREYVHRLVAKYFCKNPNNKPFVNHKDENPSNNKFDNLEWVTHKENINYGSCREKISRSAKSRTGEKSNAYRGKEHYRTKAISRSNFRKVCKKHNWDINDFKEVFSGKIYEKNKDKLYYFVEVGHGA